MRNAVFYGLVLGSLLGGAGRVVAQEHAQCADELARVKLELAIADRATPLHDQAFQQAAQQLRKEVAGEWAKAQSRAEVAQKRAEDLAKQAAAASPAPTAPAQDAR